MHASVLLKRYRWRWLALAIALVVLALVVTLALHIHALLQPERFTTLLERNLSAAGLTLTLDAPAEPQLFPRPGVELHGITLATTGADAPLLRASAATIVVPWRALLRKVVAIERIDIETPRVDLGELEALLARLPRHAGPPVLPTIATGIHMRDGTLSDHAVPLLFGFSIDTGALTPGKPFQLTASARGANGRALTASLLTTPSPPHAGAINFSATQLRLQSAGGIQLQLQGSGHWRGGEDLAMRLTGALQSAPLTPPRPAAASATVVAPAARNNSLLTNQITLDVIPRQGTTPLTVAIKLEGVDTHADVRVQPTEIMGWWQQMLAGQPGAIPAQPFSGKATIRQLEFGSFKASGIEIAATPDPAPASSVAPASATSTAH